VPQPARLVTQGVQDGAKSPAGAHGSIFRAMLHTDWLRGLQYSDAFSMG
jgi:hypothetical protein